MFTFRYHFSSHKLRCRFFRPEQARSVFGACRDNDERLAFVSKVMYLELLLNDRHLCSEKTFITYASFQAMFKIAVENKDHAQQEVVTYILNFL